MTLLPRTWVGLEWKSYVSTQAVPHLCRLSLWSLVGTIGGAWGQVVPLSPAYAVTLCSLWASGGTEMDFEDPCISQSTVLVLEQSL